MGPKIEGKKILFVPEEVTITDPLYEPLKLLNFPTCRHISWLNSFSHKSFGLSPSLLYDIEKMKIIAGIICEKYPVTDKYGMRCRAEILTKFYYPYIRSLFKFYFLSIEKFECEMVEQKEADNIKLKTLAKGFLNLNQNFKVYKLLRHLILSLYYEMTDEYLALLHGEIIRIKGKKVNNPELSDTLFHDAINDAIKKAKIASHNLKISCAISSDDLIQRLCKISKTELNALGTDESFKNLIIGLITCEQHDSSEINKIFQTIVDTIKSSNLTKLKVTFSPTKYNTQLKVKVFDENIAYCDGFLFNYTLNSVPLKKELNYYNYSQISDYLKFESQIQVKCPCCKTFCILSEHSKVIELQNALLKTFEMRRSKWLLMTGSLHLFFRGATHTRLSHQVGTLIATINTFNLMNVNISRELIIPFGNYLYLTNSTFEFLLTQVLHDIGHAPMSHVLEKNPFFDYDHEAVTSNLISGKSDSGNNNSYKTQYHYLKMRYIHEYCDLYEKLLDAEQKKKYKNPREYLDEIDLIISSEIVTVKRVLANFGINRNKIIDILKDPPENKAQSPEQKYSDIFHSLNERDRRVLHAFLHSAVDLDRIDHVKRDSTMSGVSLFNAKLDDLLGSMLIILPEGTLHNSIHFREGIKNDYPFIMISENGINYFLDLLNTRKIIYREVLFSDQNNWINGVLNQMTAYAIQYQPHFPQLLPFITDQVIFHLYNHKQLNLAEFKKYNRLVQGRKGYGLFGEPARYKFIGTSLSKETMKKIYKKVEEKNRDQSHFIQSPTFVFFTSISIADDDKQNFCPLKQTAWDDIFIYGKMVDNKYRTFKDLTEKSNNPRFKDFWKRPDENDVKNLLYIWVNSLVTFGDCNTSGKSKKFEHNKNNEQIMKKQTKIERIYDLMVDIDDIINGSLTDKERERLKKLYPKIPATFFTTTKEERERLKKLHPGTTLMFFTEIFSMDPSANNHIANNDALSKCFKGDMPSETGGNNV